MDNGAKFHYESHLAKYYSWIFGGAESCIVANAAFFRSHAIEPRSSKVAIDLGAGSGFQSIPLAQVGFDVVAIDFSRRMLDELAGSIGESGGGANAGGGGEGSGLGIETIEADILDFDAYAGRNPELIVCMGDTLTHLKSLADVRSLIENCRRELVENGLLILSFRDLTEDLSGSERFIPVKNDEDLIFTCFLEYHTASVTVTDIVYERGTDGWDLKLNSYEKVKLPPATIAHYLTEAGFTVELDKNTNGMVTMICRSQQS